MTILGIYEEFEQPDMKRKISSKSKHQDIDAMKEPNQLELMVSNCTGIDHFEIEFWTIVKTPKLTADQKED